MGWDVLSGRFMQVIRYSIQNSGSIGQGEGAHLSMWLEGFEAQFIEVDSWSDQLPLVISTVPLLSKGATAHLQDRQLGDQVAGQVEMCILTSRSLVTSRSL